ncbi:MAG TPA: uroporphyrinogen-III synthase [Steroidobacteraceae bacterium]|nr:uroporphyrinogen-III synthase [Steroidobacteraceae bacterium]
MRSVVVTRDEAPDGPLSCELRGFGLAVLSWPAVRVLPPADSRALDAALARVREFDWIVFASRHAVEAVAERLGGPPSGLEVAAVGARTAEALRERGWRVDVVPQRASATELLAVLAPRIARGARVLSPASARALATLGEGLRALGAEVCEVEAYRTEANALDVAACRAHIERQAIGAVTFTSPSCVEELGHALGRAHFERLLATSAAIALGPTTGRALAECGFEPVLADPATLAGLAATTYRVLREKDRLTTS